MFSVGSKIVILKSGNNRQNTGSIAYVENTWSTRVFTKENFIATLCKVVFIRYGLEQKERHERKSIIVLFPIFDHETKENQLPVLYNKVFSKKRTKFREEIRKNMGDLKATIVVATPYNSTITDLTCCSKAEFGAWFSCYINNIAVRDAVSSAIINEHFLNFKLENLRILEAWSTLHRVISEKLKGILEFVNHTEAAKSRKIIIEIVKGIELGPIRKSSNKVITNITGNILSHNLLLKRNELKDYHFVYSYIGQYLFDKAIYHMLKSKLMTSDRFKSNKNIKTLLNDIDLVKKELSSLSSQIK